MYAAGDVKPGDHMNRANISYERDLQQKLCIHAFHPSTVGNQQRAGLAVRFWKIAPEFDYKSQYKCFIRVSSNLRLATKCHLSIHR